MDVSIPQRYDTTEFVTKVGEKDGLVSIPQRYDTTQNGNLSYFSAK